MEKLGILRLLYRLFVHGTTKASGLFLWSESMALYQDGDLLFGCSFRVMIVSSHCLLSRMRLFTAFPTFGT
jgi:hypothetical protein